MDVEAKWVDWYKPIYLKSLGIEIRDANILATLKKTGCFRFNDGTTQNWKLNQLYETSTQKKIMPATINNIFYGFILTNSQNLALAASADPLVITDSTIKSCDIYLESPDLLKDSNWWNISGYSIDIQRSISSLCGDTIEEEEEEKKNQLYFAQLQMLVIDESDNSEHLLVECDEQNKKEFKFNFIDLSKNYNLTIELPKEPIYQIKQIRVRLTMPNMMSFNKECYINGKWLIGNVCPKK